MNVEALTSQTSARATSLSAQAPASPGAAQLADDRKAIASPAAKGAKAPSPADIKKASSQFEAIILRQLLEPSIQPVMSGGLGGGGESSGGGIYGYMLTDVLANSLSKGGGLGLARLLEQQFTAKSSSQLKALSSSTSTPST